MSTQAPTRLAGIARIPQYVLLTAMVLVAIGPVIWTVASSFRSSTDILTDVFGAPVPPTTQGYRDAFQLVDLHINIGNTLLYACAAAVLCPLVALLLAYPCTRLRFPLRNAIVLLVSAGIAVPAISLIVPEFFIMLRLGLLDTKHGMIVFYSALFLPLAFVILRAFLVNIPHEVEEAAAIDGASYFRVLFGVVAPMALPALMTVAILVFISVWNDFLWNLLIASGADNLNAQVVLASFRGRFQFNIAALLAGTAIVLLVPILLFLFTQRYAIAGLAGTTGVRRRGRTSGGGRGY